MVDRSGQASIGRTGDGATTLPRRRLGHVGIDVSVLSLGGAGLGGLYTPVAEEEARRTIRRALQLGINYVDNSPFYGECERRLGEVLLALGGRPADFHLSTKVGTHPARYGDYSAEAARWSVEQSLRVLGLESVDLVQVHALEGIDMDVVLAPGGAVEELERLRDEGKVGAIGLGVRGHDYHRRAIVSGRFDALLLYSDYTLVRQTAASLIEEAAAAGLGVLFGRALLVGLLAGGDPLADERLAQDADAAAARAWWLWARERGVPLQALALQFPMRHPGISSVVVGASSAREIEENVAAATFPIPEEVWTEVEERVSRGGVPG